MTVKCKRCGNRISKTTAYSVSTEKQHYYFCTEKEYSDFMAEKECKEYILDLLDNISGITVSTHRGLLNTLKQLSNEYSCYSIQEYLESNYDYLSHLFFCKTFKTTSSQIKYLTVVLSNNIPQHFTPASGITPVLFSDEYEEYKSHYKNKQKRKSLADY